MAKITLLLHRKDPYPKKKYHLIWPVAKCWEEMGHRVEVCKGVPKAKIETDLWIPHIDLTVIPTEYREFLDNCHNVLNPKIYDISKSRISSHLINRNDLYNGAVIVKTDKNYGGIPEARMNFWANLYRQTEKNTTKIAGKSFLRRKTMSPHLYKVYSSPDKVPVAVWSNPNLVVEKYLAERIDGKYSIRICLFLGDVIRTSQQLSDNPVIKGTNNETRLIEADQGIINYIKHAGMDYGKLDYVVHKGNVHVFDVNKTPGCVSDQKKNRQIALKLAKGIDLFLS